VSRPVVIRVTCFRFICPGKMSGRCFLEREDALSRELRPAVFVRSTLVMCEWKRAIEETDMIRQGMLRCHGNWM
jgi:hypothetical protein